jgi:hypothetical protein
MAVSNLLKRTFRIQYVSDLHLEFYDKAVQFSNFVRPVAPYLALAGDIGKPGHPQYKRFFDHISPLWKDIFYVTGNHEYYDTPREKWAHKTPTTFQERHKEIQDFVAGYENVHLLDHDNPSVFLPTENMAIVGSTLWTHIPEDMRAHAFHGMNDYNFIAHKYDDDKILPISPAIVSEIHEKEKHMLEAQIGYWFTQNVDVAVITHHMPSFSLISPRYADNPINICFASNCEKLMLPNVKAWFYGHTHNAASGMFGNTFVACNSRGYPRESIPGFDTMRTFEYQRQHKEGGGMEPELAASAFGIKSPQIQATNRAKSPSPQPEDDDDIVWV